MFKGGSDFFKLNWVRADGYELKEPKTQAASTLVGAVIYKTGNLNAQGWPGKPGTPHHRIFANLKNSQDTLAFVRSYGFLGLDKGKNPGEIESESVQEILEASQELATALDFVDKLNRELKSSLNRAKAQSQKVTEKRNTGYQSIVSMFNLWAKRHAQCGIQLVPAVGGAPISIEFSPRSLLVALWLLAAEEIAGRVQYRTCPVCNGFIEIGQGRGSLKKKFCSKTCKDRDVESRRGPRLDKRKGYRKSKSSKKK